MYTLLISSETTVRINLKTNYMMLINDPALYPYISGELFSNGLAVKFDLQKQKEFSRIDILLEITKGKRIIHLGFADHIPLIKEKISTNSWLHGLLEKNCSECFGVDICAEAVEYVKTEFNYSNVVCANILKDDILRDKDGVFDYVVLGEILEHTDNPVEFLKNIQEKYQGRIKEIIITVPNVFNKKTISSVQKGIENINSDHRYWFSPYTILKVVHRAGFKTARLQFANLSLKTYGRRAWRRVAMALKIKLVYHPQSFSTIVCIASF